MDRLKIDSIDGIHRLQFFEAKTLPGLFGKKDDQLAGDGTC